MDDVDSRYTLQLPSECKDSQVINNLRGFKVWLIFASCLVLSGILTDTLAGMHSGEIHAEQDALADSDNLSTDEVWTDEENYNESGTYEEYARRYSGDRKSERRILPLIGLTGPIGAGKGTCAEYLSRRAFKHCLIRDYLAELAAQQGLEPTRANLLKLGNELRAEHGPAVLVERLCKEATKHWQDGYIIDSVRTVAEAETLMNYSGMLIAVDAPLEVRYKRICDRNSTTDSRTFEQFVEDNTREERSEDPCRPSLLAVMNLSQHQVNNDGNHTALYETLDGILRRRAVDLLFDETSWRSEGDGITMTGGAVPMGDSGAVPRSDYGLLDDKEEKSAPGLEEKLEADLAAAQAEKLEKKADLEEKEEEEEKKAEDEEAEEEIGDPRWTLSARMGKTVKRKRRGDAAGDG